jgi:hypothetical protein
MRAFVPQISKIEDRKVVTVASVGDPNEVMDPYMKALYGAVYFAKMKVYKPKGIRMELGKLAAFWPDAHLKPKNEWTGIWGVKVPEYVTQKDIIQKDPKIPAKVEIWKGGECAEVLFVGAYADEGPTIQKLHDFIKESGYKIVGSHEEEYLTKPGPKAKTIIRYLIRRV